MSGLLWVLVLVSWFYVTNDHTADIRHFTAAVDGESGHSLTGPSIRVSVSIFLRRIQPTAVTLGVSVFH